MSKCSRWKEGTNSARRSSTERRELSLQEVVAIRMRKEREEKRQEEAMKFDALARMVVQMGAGPRGGGAGGGGGGGADGGGDGGEVDGGAAGPAIADELQGRIA